MSPMVTRYFHLNENAEANVSNSFAEGMFIMVFVYFGLVIAITIAYFVVGIYLWRKMKRDFNLNSLDAKQAKKVRRRAGAIVFSLGLILLWKRKRMQWGFMHVKDHDPEENKPGDQEAEVEPQVEPQVVNGEFPTLSGVTVQLGRTPTWGTQDRDPNGGKWGVPPVWVPGGPERKEAADEGNGERTGWNKERVEGETAQ